MITKLLTNTFVTISIGSYQDDGFNTNLGIPQGDSLSPILFIIYLEAVLRDVCQLHRISMDQMIVYADDSDIVVENIYLIDKIQAEAPAVFDKWGLTMNVGKTEVTTIWRQSDRIDETWLGENIWLSSLWKNWQNYYTLKCN